MAAPQLKRYVASGVTLLGDESRPGGVTFAFTERTGGVSVGPYASLNLGLSCGDDADAVRENRRRALAGLGLGHLGARLVGARQVHGAHVVCIEDGAPSSLEAARTEIEAGADGIVCSAANVPVMLLSADCALVVLVCEGAFAVAHSGWRGTISRIAAVALGELCRVAGATPSQVRAYVGPHIGRDDYEVSEELLERFVDQFGPGVAGADRLLDLGFAIGETLVEEGVARESMASAGVSTASATDRFFSYRAEGGTCGRNAAIACIVEEQKGVEA